MTAEGWRGEGAVLFGGSGFLGSAVLRAFPAMLSAGRSAPAAPNRHIPVADLRDLSPLDGIDFDRVLCCTGTSRHVELMAQPLEASLEVHVLPSVRLLEGLAPRRLRAFVRLSTVLLYAESEAPLTEASPVAPYRNRYLLGQYLGEQAAHDFEGGAPVATVRLCNLYGPWPAPRTDLVHETAAQLAATGRARIRTRRPERDFLYVDDAARAVGLLARAGASGVFNLGSGRAASAGEIADTLARLSGGTVESDDEPARGVARVCVDSGKLRAATGWAPAWTLESGLAATWEAMRAARD